MTEADDEEEYEVSDGPEGLEEEYYDDEYAAETYHVEEDEGREPEGELADIPEEALLEDALRSFGKMRSAKRRLPRLWIRKTYTLRQQ